MFIPLSGLLLSKNAEVRNKHLNIAGFLAPPISTQSPRMELIGLPIQVREARYDYTKCHEISLQDELETMPRENFDEYFKGSTVSQPVVQWMRSERPRTFDKVTKNYTTCIIEFFLPEDLQPPIHLYYHLTNFNQNHRKYGTSFSKSQLAGKNVSLSSLEDSCKPVSAAGGEKNGSQKIVYPCGVIANSVFNDTFENPRRFVDTFKKSSSRSVPYKMTKSNIASLIDRQLFKPSSYTVSDKAGANDSLIVPPPNWIERYPRGYHKDNMFNPAEDEAFMVWMRTAASPTFAKLAMRNDDQPMLRGLYRLEVFSCESRLRILVKLLLLTAFLLQTTLSTKTAARSPSL